MRPRLLFLSQTVPYPPDGGPWIRTYNLLRALSSAFDLELLCFERTASEAQGFKLDPSASLAALSELGPTEVFPVPQRRSRLRFVADHLRSVATGRAFTHYLYDSGAFRQALRRALARGPDLVHVDSLDLAAYLPLLPLTVACTHHNVESSLLLQRSRSDPSWAVRRYAALQATLTRKDERTWCPRVDLNVVVSQEDAQTFRALAPEARFLVVPNGVDIERLQPAPEEPGGGLVFAGMTNWFPNRDGFEYLCREILPLLRERRPGLRVTWIGAATAEYRREMKARYDVELTGYVQDFRPYVQAAQCYVVPLRVGGGSRLKILDAWAMGKAVVSTSLGCEGLAAEHGHNLLIADTPASFAEAALRVLDDASLRQQLGAHARATAETRYAWSIIGGELVTAYQELLARRTRPASAPSLRA